MEIKTTPIEASSLYPHGSSRPSLAKASIPSISNLIISWHIKSGRDGRLGARWLGLFLAPYLQSVVHRTASPGSLLERQNIWSCPSPT